MNIDTKDPKKVMGYVFAAIVAAGLGVVFFVFILPILVTIVWNLISLAIGITIAAFLAYFLLNPKTWRSIRYLGEASSQALLGWAIEMNPFNILQLKIERTEKDNEKLLEYNTQLKSKSVELKEKIAKNDAELKKSMEIKTMCEDSIRTDPNNFTSVENLEIAIGSINDATDYINTIKPVYNDTLKLVDFTERAYRTAKLELTTAKNTLNKRRDLFETVTTASATMNKAWKALLGDKNLNDDADRALNALQKDVSEKIGKIQSGIKITSQFMDSKDLENAAKLKTTLKSLQGVNLETANYSDTIDSAETKIEMKNLSGGANKYLKQL